MLSLLFHLWCFVGECVLVGLSVRLGCCRWRCYYLRLDCTDIAQKTDALIHHEGPIRGIDPSRNLEILHLSISGRPFTTQATPAPQ